MNYALFTKFNFYALTLCWFIIFRNALLKKMLINVKGRGPPNADPGL